MLRCDNPLAVRIFRGETDWLRARGEPVPEALLLEERSIPYSRHARVATLRAEVNAAISPLATSTVTRRRRTPTHSPHSAPLAPEASTALLANRTKCHLRMKRGGLALADAEAALAADPTHAKCLLQRARALLLLQRPRDAARRGRSTTSRSTTSG